MTVLAFIFCFIAALFNLVLSILRLFFNMGAEYYNDDGGSSYRSKKYKKAFRAFLWSILFFILASHFAMSGLGL